ncbi:MAG: hypothetical protein II279_02305 [Bacteroidaceae bacterium]|nr:hypothetical protein [Bacteroidaceae bacterium]
MVRTKAKTTKETKKTTRKKAAAAPKKKTIPTQNVLKLIKNDSALSVFADAINGRHDEVSRKMAEITAGSNNLNEFAMRRVLYGKDDGDGGFAGRME